jgi:large subunit ribosomal protein L11
VYEDRTYSFVLKTSPASALILKAAGIEKGAGKHAVKKAGTITRAKIREIAEKKMPDLNANTIEAAMKIIEGSCRSLGVDVKG